MIELPSQPSDTSGKKPAWLRYLSASAFVGLALLVRQALDGVLGERLPFVTMFPAVAAAVWFAGVGPGVFAALLSLASAQFFFVLPRYSFGLSDQFSMVAASAFALSSAIIVALGRSLEKSRRRNEQARQRIQRIVDALPALVSLIDEDLRYRLVNATYTKWFKVSGDQIVGKTVTEVLGAEAFARVQPWMEKALAGQEVSFRDHLPYSHGGARWVEVTYRPYRTEDLKIRGLVVLVNDISEQHRTEEIVHEREREFRAIFELNATGCVLADAESSRFTRVNQKFCELTGYTATELLTKTFADITHPEDLARDRELFRSALQSRATNWESEKRYLRKDGSIRWVAVRGTILRDATGRAMQTVATIMDLTAWKESQHKLTESEARFRQAVEAGQFGAWEWSIPENRVVWSDRLYDIHGVAPEDFKGDVESFQKLVHPDDWHEVQKAIQSSLQEGSPYRLEFRAIRPNGATRWLWTTAQVFFEGRHPLKMVGITADITDRKEIEIQLRESEERLRLAQRAAKVGTWDWHLKTNQLVWSEGIYDLLGLPPWQIEPSMEVWMSFIHPDDRPDLKAFLPQTLSRGGAFSTEFRIVRPNGDVRWLLSIGRIDNDEKHEAIRMLGVNVDITERKKAEALLQSQAQHLEELVRARTERLEEVILELESFSYTIAHDLRGPLRAMNGFATALVEDYGKHLAAEGRDYLRRITTAAERMDRLICDVLSYSKITRETFQPEAVALEPLLEGILESYPALHAGGAAVILEKPLPVVLGTSSLLVQCFSNLIGNAVKFVPPGVPPSVRVRAETRPGDCVRIWVEDNGLGIDSEDHQRIFGLFQRLNKEYDGTGIGLAIVARAVERMGGNVGLESSPGQGSRFWVDLKMPPPPRDRTPS